MAENKKVQIKNTGGDALYPRTAAESIVNVPGGTMNVFMYINGYGNENQFPDPYKGDRYFDIAAHKVYECVTDTTWTGKKEITSWDSNTLFFWNGEVWKYTDSEEGPLAPVLCATVDQSVTNGVCLNGGNGSPLKAVASSATTSQFGTVKTDATVTNGASLVNTNGSIKATVSSATASQLGTVKITTTESNGVKLGVTNGAVSATQTFATNAEASAGSISSKGVTPAAMKYAKTWTAIQDKGTSATVTLAPGGVFKVAPTGATVTLSAGTVSAGMYGADARLEMYLGSETHVSAVAPLILADPLTPNAGNNCVIKYRGGNAYLYKEGTEAGYVVTSQGTNAATSGTLAYGIANSQGWIVVPNGSHYLGSANLKKDTSIVCLTSADYDYNAGVQNCIDITADTTSGSLHFTNGGYISGYVSKGNGAVSFAGDFTNITFNGGSGGIYFADSTTVTGGGFIYGSTYLHGGSNCSFNSLVLDRCRVSDEDMFAGADIKNLNCSECVVDDVGSIIEYGVVSSGLIKNCSNTGPEGLFNAVTAQNVTFDGCTLGRDACLIHNGGATGCTFVNNSITSSGGSAALIRTSWGGMVIKDCTVSSNTAKGVYLGLASDTIMSNCTITKNSSGVVYVYDKVAWEGGDYGDWTYDRSEVVAGCVISGNAAYNGCHMIVDDGAVTFTGCELDTIIRCTSNTQESGACITFKGSNHFVGNINSANGFAYPEHVYIEDGAIVDVSGSTPGVISAYKTSGRIQVGTFDSHGQFTAGGTATVIFGSDRQQVLSGTSNYRCISGGSAT